MNKNNPLMRRLLLLFIVAISLSLSCSTPPQTTDDLSTPLTEAAPGEKSLPINDSDIIPIANSPTRGPDAARVTIVMFTDLQCPFCQRAVLTMEVLQRTYPNEVKLVLKNNPLPFHKEAAAAAYATIAAGNQGYFWEMHNWLFENQRAMTDHRNDLKAWTAQYASQLGLDVVRFEADFDAPETQAVVARDIELAQKLNARGTPTFFINGERLVGAQPLEKFEVVVRGQLDEAQKLTQSGVADADLYRQLVAENYRKEIPHPVVPGKPEVTRKDAPAVQFVPVETDDPIRGNAKDALVTIVEFSDFQCPFCARALPTIEKIHDTYGDQVRVVYKQNPMSMHALAKPAAQAALAAKQQGKFWEMHDLLFKNQLDFGAHADDFETYAAGFAAELGLDLVKFKQDYQSKAVAEKIERDIKLAAEVGARGTPNFWINGVNLRGAQPFDTFAAAIDAQIIAAQKLKDEKKLSGDALYKAAVELNKAEAK